MRAILAAILLLWSAAALAQETRDFDPGEEPIGPARPVRIAGEEKTWSVPVFNNTPWELLVAFGSGSRMAYWPGPKRGTAWVLGSGDKHTIEVKCVKGEAVCFGAHATSDATRYWGMGGHLRFACPSSCYTCGDRVSEISLNP